MTGFSAQWLALREPVDHKSRNLKLRQAMVQHFESLHPTLGKSKIQPFKIIDLGCGSGSNLRALAEVLPQYQHWSLIDYDPELLKAAKASLKMWAGDNSEEQPSTETSLSTLFLKKSGKHLTIDFLQVDLAKNIEIVLDKEHDLVTAAAFFDLVSPDWLVRFCLALKTPLYTVLTYDGIEKWLPAHRTDALVLNAFHMHQQTDKGFGKSAGPDAIEIMQNQLSRRNFDVYLEKSPWQLNGEDQSLMQALASGSAAAVAETKLLAPGDLQDWLTSRLQATYCEIGHWDLFARPGLAQKPRPLLHISDVTFRYPEQVVFKNLNASLAPGVALVRCDESRGKTTLLKLLAGLLLPEQGEITAYGFNSATDSASYRNEVFFTASNAEDFDQISAHQYFQRMQTQYPGFDMAVIPQLIEGLGLTSHQDKPLYMLSTGSKRKVWIAAAIACNAKITLIDDLTAALDRGSIDFIIEQLACLAKQAQRHVIISHYDTLERVPFTAIIDI